jgi:hypothetical protein
MDRGNEAMVAKAGSKQLYLGRNRMGPGTTELVNTVLPGRTKIAAFSTHNQPSADCTLIAPTSKHPEEWLTRDYTEIHSGETVRLSCEYNGKVLSPQTLSSVIWRHYFHPEDKSLSPDGERSNAYTRGLLLRRPIEAMTPFVFIGKEIERRAQEGEDVSVLENTGPIQYHRQQTAETRAADGWACPQSTTLSPATAHARIRVISTRN